MSLIRHLHLTEENSLSPSHTVKDVLGEGRFGFVAKCRNIPTKQKVAVEPKSNDFYQSREERDVLKKLRDLDPETSNIIRSQGFFHNASLTFELLDLSLYDYMRGREDPGLPLSEVRPVLKQVSSALTYLSSKRIVHADIKPDSIMVVNRNEKPIQVKLSRFDLTLMVSACQPGVRAGTLWYMAPEMILGAPFNEAIDMWSLGQTAVEMITGYPMYPGRHAYDVLRFIVQTQGQPEDSVLDQGQATEEVFSHQSDGPGRWRFRTPQEFDYSPEETRHYIFKSLDDLERMLEWQRGYHRDHLLLLDLIKRMLSLNQEQRIKPLEVLGHPFVSESPAQSSCPEGERRESAGSQETFHKP